MIILSIRLKKEIIFKFYAVSRMMCSMYALNDILRRLP